MHILARSKSDVAHFRLPSCQVRSPLPHPDPSSLSARDPPGALRLRGCRAPWPRTLRPSRSGRRAMEVLHVFACCKNTFSTSSTGPPPFASPFFPRSRRPHDHVSVARRTARLGRQRRAVLYRSITALECLCLCLVPRVFLFLAPPSPHSFQLLHTLIKYFRLTLSHPPPPLTLTRRASLPPRVFALLLHCRPRTPNSPPI